MIKKRSNAIEVQLRITKESYSVEEPIEVTVVLKNGSNDPLTINKRMGINPGHMGEGSWEVKFDVAFPPGQRLMIDTLINRGQPSREDFTLLPPRGEISTVYPLTKFYWMKLLGAYQVRATYHNSVDGSQFGLSAWTGEITSNPIHLKVTE
jgi:hypothetical protein